MKRITVAYVIGGLPFGGVENWLHDLALALRADSDPEFSVDARIINVSGTGRKMEDFEAAGIEVLTAGDSKKALKTHNLATVRKVRGLLREIRPDIVHTLQFSGDYFGRLGALGLRVPVVTHIRNLKSERSLRRRLINKLLSFATTGYLAVSKATAKTIARDHNWAKRPVAVLYNGVDPAKLNVEPLDFRAAHGLEGPVILAVGRLVEQKNFDLVLRALRLILDGGVQASVCIVGDGGQRDALEGLVRELDLQDHAVLTGYVPNAEVPRYLRGATVLCMPSDYEGLPVTHVEALFCGLPAVVSRFVPSLEIAAGACLVAERDPVDLAKKLEVLIADPARRDQFSRSALAIAPDLSMDRYLEKLKKYYADLLAR